MKQVAIAIDQLINTLCGGYADETLSARIWRHRDDWPRALLIVNSIFFWQTNHCRESYESEVERKHLPRGYRSPP